MNTFAQAVQNQMTVTENAMPARRSSGSPLVDFFYQAGAHRGKDIVPLFVAAFVEEPILAMRSALWLRDAREGAGERELFRQILRHLEINQPEFARMLLGIIPELGRWDDMLTFETPELKSRAFDEIGVGLKAGNGLCAKWMPRKGKLAVELRKHLGMTPKQYRKTLVNLTQVVETQMCANEWDEIEFSKVPSLAAARYKKAFNRHTTKYQEYVAKLVKGEAGVKVNTGAVYPYDVLKGLIHAHSSGSWYREETKGFDKTELDFITAQWEALPNYLGDQRVLALVDVSGSMDAPAGRSSVTALEIAVSLGLYFADKLKGRFKDTFLTFSGSPELLHLQGNIIQKIQQMVTSRWSMNTSLELAMALILKVAKQGGVAQDEMPETLVILSDMQFDQCIRDPGRTGMEMIRKMYAEAGYKVPGTVFWNLRSTDNAPVGFKEYGTALVSGFSPAIAASILGGDLSDLTPEAIMMRTIMKDRYSF